jgi:hypothetical protein
MQSNHFEQEQNEDDGEDEAEASSAVVAEPWSHAITTKAEHKNQDDQKDKHFLSSPYGEDSPDGWCDACFVAGAIIFGFPEGCLRVGTFFGRGTPLRPPGILGKLPVFIGWTLL